MNKKILSIFNKKNRPILRVFATFLIGFFLIMTLLTAFVAVPKINQSLETQHIVDGEITLQIETELFKRFISNNRTILDDLAKFPVITSAALLSKSDNPDFTDLVDNFAIAGSKSRLVLQNIAGDIIYQTANDMKGNFRPSAPWIKAILNGEAPYNFQLLEQEKDHFRFVISVPVIYLGHTEGLLSAEITAPLTVIFSPKTMEEGGAFKLQQGNVIVQTDNSSILLPREVSTDIVEKNIELTYISDDTQILQAQNHLRNTILAILFFGLAVSFILFTLLGYRTLSDSDSDSDSDSEDNVKASYKKRAYIMPVMIALIGVAASLSGALMFDNFQRQQYETEQRASALQKINAVREQLNSNLQTLASLKAFFDSSDFVSRDEFKQFTSPLLKSNPDIQAMEWVPKVLKNERVEYKEAAIEDGFQEYDIVEPDYSDPDNIIFSPAPERDVYYPVYYVEPYQGNEKVLGLDTPNNTSRTRAIQRAIDTGKPSASKPFRLVQEVGDQYGVLIFSPVYQKTQTVDEGKNVIGLSLLVLRLGDTINHSIEKYGHTLTDIGLIIKDVSDAENPLTIYNSSPNTPQSEGYITSQNLRISGRQWQINAFHTENHSYFFADDVVPIAIFFSGLIATLFITYTFIQLIRRRQVIETIVEQRTKEVQELSSAMENAVEGVSQINTKGEYIYLNEAYASTCGYKPEELVGKDWAMTVHKDDHDLMDKAYQVMLDTGKVVEEPRGIRKDGSELYKRVTMISKYDDDGKFIGHHCFMSDISDRKKAEEEILRSNIELERFAYVASHDLQEPLRMVTNFTAMLDKRYGDQLDDTAKEYIQYAYNGGRRMQDLVNDLLEYARIGQDAENFKDVDMQQVMGMIEENLKDSIDSGNAVIRYDDLPTVYANPVRLMRVLQNLVGNSIKYQESGVKPEIQISAKETNGLYTISIRDNGIGMKPEYCEQIFEPFKRLHAKNEYSGTGMGLAICRKLIEGFGGTIWAESAIGEGSTFYFTIPIHHASDLETKEETSA